MKFIWHTKSDFLSLKPITQVYGVCFDRSGNILIMREVGKSWNIPGGTPESNETPEITLKRELEEEVDITITRCEMIGYFEVVSDEPTSYQVRYAAIIDKINPQTIDPATNAIHERKFIQPNEFFDYIHYEEYRPMLEEAIRWCEKNKIFHNNMYNS